MPVIRAKAKRLYKETSSTCVIHLKIRNVRIMIKKSETFD